MYEFLGTVYELAEFKTPPDDLVARLNALIDEALPRGLGVTVDQRCG